MTARRLETDGADRVATVDTTSGEPEGFPRLVAFDLDDTLAPSKSPLTSRMTSILVRLLDVCEVCVISGGSYAQFRRQLLARLPEGQDLRRLHLMPTCGTRYLRWVGGAWTLQYAEDLSDQEKRAAVDAIEEEARRLGLWERDTRGPAIEDRGSQITFSALGQDAPIDAKAAWDPGGEKKALLRSALEGRLPGLEVRSGGSTSIDVTRVGVDKAYGMARLAELTGIGYPEMLFIGDRLDPDGNDYPVRRLGVPTRAVRGWEETAAVVEDLLAPAVMDRA